MNKKNFWIFTTLAILVLIGVSIYFRVLSVLWDGYGVDSRVSKAPNFERANSRTGKKTILLWTTFFSDDWFYFGNNSHFDSCPRYKNCLITRSRELFADTRNFDAILFHVNDMMRDKIPRERSSEQKFVFVNLESPKNRPLPDSYFENYFNVTMTYRLDSDIPWPYYIVRDIETNKVVAPFENVKWFEPSYDPMRWQLELKFDEKTKMAAWLVSNCNTYGRRELFVEELKGYVEVDGFGHCVKTVVPECARSTDQCFEEIIEPHYFFYLSFENTLCQDYVTEKFFNALRYDVIPVVYGGANYSLFAPPHSYIDALDFESPKALGNYLKNLSQDKEEYLKYFWWKRFYAVDSSRNFTLCKLCEYLNEPKPETKIYSRMSDWFLKDKCPMQNHMMGHEYATNKLKNRVQMGDDFEKFHPVYILSFLSSALLMMILIYKCYITRTLI